MKGRRKMLQVTGIVLFAVLNLLYVVLPAGFGGYAALRHQSDSGDPPAGFASITLTAPDGVQLASWYRQPENGVAVLLLHGATGSRNGVREHARMLADSGFGVLALDLRGHGRSGGGGNAFGWNCTQDVEAALEYLGGREEVKALGALGLSVGGEILLSSASAFPGLKAIAVEGATHRSVKDYLALPARRNLFRSWTTRVMYASARLWSGDRPPVTIVESLRNAPGTAFLLIASGKDADEVEYNTLFAEIADGRAELWVAAEAGHTEAFGVYPEEYESRVIPFFSRIIPATGR